MQHGFQILYLFGWGETTPPPSPRTWPHFYIHKTCAWDIRASNCHWSPPSNFSISIPSHLPQESFSSLSFPRKGKKCPCLHHGYFMPPSTLWIDLICFLGVPMERVKSPFPWKVLVIDWIMPPPQRCPNPQTCDCVAFHGKRNFAAGNKLRTLKWRLCR